MRLNITLVKVKVINTGITGTYTSIVHILTCRRTCLHQSYRLIGPGQSFLLAD